ncbi:MAG: sulfotransferase family 2 domain-containing protein [Saprospiraceae bacterium]|nr:sulfotransferase family 2 domain-containing protein [Saprospiraceae bacterium]
MESRIIFHHIPKTGGTTLIGILDQYFDIEEIMPNRYFDKPARDVTSEDVEAKAEAIKTYNLIRGHFPIPCFDNIGDDYYRICLLRNPVSRLFSLYNDWRSKTEQSLSTAHPLDVKASRLAKANNISDFLKHSDYPIPALFDNGQTRLLSDSLSKKSIGEAELIKAKETVDKMQLVGITEMLDSFLYTLCQKFKWVFPKQYQSLNTRKYDRQAMTTIDKDIFHEFLKFDLELYEYVISKFNKTVVNQLKAKNNNSQIKRHQVNHISLDMLKGFKCDGFHVREGIGGDDVWRWTGPDTESHLYFNLQPHIDYNLEIDIISVIDQEIVDNLKLKCNGTNLKIENKGAVNGKQRVSAKIGRDLINVVEEDKITIKVPFTTSHAAVQPETKDDRQKGIAITKIEIKASSDTIQHKEKEGKPLKKFFEKLLS